MAFITIDDVAVASGTASASYTVDQEAQIQYYIDFVCAYIENETGYSYSLHTDVTVRYESNPYGQVELVECPVITVTRVEDKLGVDQIYWRWTGLDIIDYLRPLTIYDIKLSYGVSGAPLPVKGVATEAVKRALNAGKSGNALTEKQVGDVRQIYANPLDAAVAFSKTDREILSAAGQPDGYTMQTSVPLQRRRYFTGDPFVDPFADWYGW